MSKLVCEHLGGAPAIRMAAPAWDALWRRSGCVAPTARAELVARLVDHMFDGACQTLIVRDGNDWLAALPVVRLRRRGMLCWDLPSNNWTTGARLLMDATLDESRQLDVARSLVDGLWQLGRGLRWFDSCELDLPPWRAMRCALAQRGATIAEQTRFWVGTVDREGTWSDYRDRWSRNHRRQVRRIASKLAAQGEAQFERCSLGSPGLAGFALVRYSALEARGWKGAFGTSLADCGADWTWFERQWQWLCRHNEAYASFLTSQGRDIAGHLGWRSPEGTWLLKMCYDETWAECSPGHALMFDALKQHWRETDGARFDFVGPLVDATARWSTGAYRLGRIVVGTHRGGNLAARILRRRWSRRTEDSTPALGASQLHVDSTLQCNGELEAAGDVAQTAS